MMKLAGTHSKQAWAPAKSSTTKTTHPEIYFSKNQFTRQPNHALAQVQAPDCCLPLTVTRALTRGVQQVAALVALVAACVVVAALGACARHKTVRQEFAQRLAEGVAVNREGTEGAKGHWVRENEGRALKKAGNAHHAHKKSKCHMPPMRTCTAAPCSAPPGTQHPPAA